LKLDEETFTSVTFAEDTLKTKLYTHHKKIGDNTNLIQEEINPSTNLRKFYTYNGNTLEFETQEIS